MVFAAVWFDGVEAGEDAGGDGFAGIGVEQIIGKAGRTAFEEPGEDGAVDDGLAELFDEVEDEGGFTGTVGVKESGEGFEAGVHDGAPDVGGEDAVTVVECGVDGVIGHVGFAAGEVMGIGDEFDEGEPVDTGGGAFVAEDGGADCGAGVAGEGEDLLADFVEHVDGEAEVVTLLGLAVAGEVKEEFGLVADFAGDHPADDFGAVRGVDCEHLGFAGFDGGGEERGSDEGEGAAGGGEEGDADAALAAGFEEVGGDGDAAGADDDFLEFEEGDFGDLFAGFFDGEAFGVFAEGEAEAGDEELGAGFGGEEGDLVGEIGVDVGRGGEVEFELLLGGVPCVGDPIVLFEVGWFAFAGFGVGSGDGAVRSGGGRGHWGTSVGCAGQVVRSYQVKDWLAARRL